MQSPVTSRHYIDQEIHDREQARIFRKLWIFAGLKQVLTTPNAYLTRTIGDVAVVIQNMVGTLKAFENVCTHRQMAMQTEPMGNRPMVCKYHAWAFDVDGKLKNMGNEFLYELTPEEKARTCLRQFALEEIGNMLFVNLDPDPLPIEAQFTPEYIASLRESSLQYDDQFAYAVFQKKHNWKINFENILDYNHIPFIHSKSFFPYISLNVNAQAANRVLPEWTRAIKARLDEKAPIRLDELSYFTGSPISFPPTWYQKEVERFGNEDRYYSWFTYPNLNIGSVYGGMFVMQQYMPVAPDRLEYHLWVLTAKKKKKSSNFAALLWGMIKAEKRIIDEDSVPLEALQAGLHAGAPSFIHGVYEAHIVRMLRWYAAHIDSDEQAIQDTPFTQKMKRHEKAHHHG
jgi:phenylpropionate dioxygenase-like ring-hydroxylating dioxygenase large terminal subunit